MDPVAASGGASTFLTDAFVGAGRQFTLLSFANSAVADVPDDVGVIRRNVPWLTAGTESSISFSPLQDLHGIITPNGLFFERYHSGRPDVEPDKHRLMIHGLVDKPLTFTL